MGICGNNFELLNMKVTYRKEIIILQINNSYDTFLEKVLQKLNLSSQNLKFLSLTYIDDKNNIIIISNEKGYKIFYEKLDINLIQNS